MISLELADKYHLELKVVLPPATRHAKWHLQMMLPAEIASEGGIPTTDNFYRNLLQQQKLLPLHSSYSVDLLGGCRRLQLAQQQERLFKIALADLINGFLYQFRCCSGEELMMLKRPLWTFLRLGTSFEEAWQSKRFRLGWQLVLFYFYQALLREDDGDPKSSIRRYQQIVELYAKRIGIRLSHNEEAGREKMLERLNLSQRVIDRPYQLERHQSKDIKLAEQTIFGLSAAFAMAFATAVAFATQQAFGNFSTPFFFSLVFSYIFKDRLKELGRNYLMTKFYARFYQRHYRLSQPGDKEPMFEIRESFFQPHGRALEQQIQAMTAKMLSGENVRIEGAWSFRREYKSDMDSPSVHTSRFYDNLTINLSKSLRLLPGHIQTVWQPAPQRPKQVHVHSVSSVFIVITAWIDGKKSNKIYRLHVSRKGVHRLKEVEVIHQS